MKNPTFIQVTRWTEMQCYKDRDPKWIKIYRELLDDYNFNSLSDATKFHVIGLRLLAAKLDNKIPKDEEWIRNKLGAKEEIDLDSIEQAGFIEAYNGKENCVQIRTDSYLEKSKNREKKEAYSEDFLSFWKSYPRKIGKGAAYKSFLKASFDSLDELLAAVEQQSQSEAWLKDGGQFIPHPTTWLNQCRWEDEVDVAIKPQDKWKQDLPSEDDVDNLFKKLGVA